MYYYRNRWYDPETRRFISEDPIGFAGGDVNLYGYVWNNPYGYIDPFGFWRCSSNDPPGSSGWWDVVQGALDVAGLAPVVGLPADVLNAGISAARGNYTDAALSMAAAVPVIGTAAGAAKLAKTANKLVKGGDELLLDTNVIISHGKRFVQSGQNITKSSVSDIEIRSLVNRGKIRGVPAAAKDIPVVGLPGVNARINVRAGLTPGRSGNFADGIIGGTALERGSTLVTKDKKLRRAVIRAGGKVRSP